MKNENVWKRFEEKYIPVTESGCWLWIAASKGEKSGGHGTFVLRGKERMGAHRASWILHNGPIPEGMQVLHKCDIGSCVNPRHLFLGTQQDNIEDMVRKGRQRGTVGSRHHNTNLNERDVRFMRALHAKGVHKKWLGQIFGLKRSMVWNITAGKNWMQP